MLSHRSEISEPHVRLPSLGVWLGGRCLRVFGFEAQKGLIMGAPQDWGETETPLLEGAHKFLYALGPRAKRVTSQRSWAKGICWSWRYPREMGLGEGGAAHHRDKVTGGKGIFREYSWDLLEFDILASRPDPTQQLINSSAGMPQAK